MGLEGSHLSQQFGVLRRANLVRTRKEGSTVIYSLADRRIAKVLALSREILLAYLTETAGHFPEASMSLVRKMRQVGRVGSADPAEGGSPSTRSGRAVRSRSGRSTQDRATAASWRSHRRSGPPYDVERYGARLVASPRHADALLVTGPVTHNMASRCARPTRRRRHPSW